MEYLQHYNATCEGAEKEFRDFYGVLCSDTFSSAIDAVFARSERSNLRLLEIGCSGGNKLCIFQKLGFKSDNLYGVDICANAVKVAQDALPNSHIQHVSHLSPYEYNLKTNVDVVFCCAVLPHILPTERHLFYKKIIDLKPKYLVLCEPQADRLQKVENWGWTFHWDNYVNVSLTELNLPSSAVLYRKDFEYDEKMRGHFAPNVKESVVVIDVRNKT